LICLLKFVNNKTLQCYPRKATISSMTGLSYSTIYRATVWLIRVKIVSKKRLPSTLLYTINSKYIVGNRVSSHIDNRDRSGGLSDRSAGSLYNRTNTITTIDKLIKEVVDKGGDRSKIISTLATLPADTLNKAIKEKDNPYFCSLAIQEQSEKRGKLVDIPRNIVDNFRKKTHFGYQSKVSKTKRDYDRKIKSKDLLRGDSKDKW